MNYDELIEDAAAYVQAYMDKHEGSNLSFHNSIHMKEEVEAARKIATHYQLEERESAIVKVAAYFHDIGYYDHGCKVHEVMSSDLAEELLRKKDIYDEMISQVMHCILATKPPQNPKHLLEENVCDADL